MSSAAIEASGVRTAALEQVSVAVLYGGTSPEREVSLVSGRGVEGALAGSRLLRAVRGVEIDARGRWLVDGRALAPERALGELDDVDVFFLGLHGGAGEDGTLQGLLESCSRRYTGSGVRASALCMDKQAVRATAAAEGLRVAPGVAFAAGEWRRERAAITARIRSELGARAVVKPRWGGSSVATAVVETGSSELAQAVDAALAVDPCCLVETFQAGVEVSCGVLGNALEEPRSLPAVEIRPAPGRFFDYQQKYDPEGALELCPAPSLSPESERAVGRAAARAHRVAGCDGYSRVDFIVPPRGDLPTGEGSQGSSGGEPVLLEINTLPGLTPRSLLPREAAAVGIDYPDLCLEILARALARPWPFD
jgi:D-alanine-D-alanine ligase